VNLNDIEEILEFADVEPETVDQIWRDVKANQAKLRSCRGPHDFQPIPVEGKQLIRDYRCSRCGGKTSATNKIWYNEGLEHGRKEVKAVLEKLRKEYQEMLKRLSR